MSSLPKTQLPKIDDPSRIKMTPKASQYADFENTCNVMAYVHVEWPNGGSTNFTLRPHETHSLYIGTGGDPCACYSTVGVINDCGDTCGPITGGGSYKTC
jgi:hypothetical protein